MDKNQILIKWLLTCPEIDELHALFGTEKDRDKHFIRTKEIVLARYIDGSTKNKMDISINYYSFVTFDTCYDENLRAYAKCQNICDWVKKQANTGKLPVFKNCKVTDLYPANESPIVVDVNTSQIAKFVVGICVEYTDNTIY